MQIRRSTKSATACFGTKGPSTAGDETRFNDEEIRIVTISKAMAFMFPLFLWSNATHLRELCEVQDKSFTVPSTFLETVRFCKITLGLRGCDDILSSGRLLGFAAILKAWHTNKPTDEPSQLPEIRSIQTPTAFVNDCFLLSKYSMSLTSRIACVCVCGALLLATQRTTKHRIWCFVAAVRGTDNAIPSVCTDWI